MRKLLDRANHVYMMNLLRAKTQIWAAEDHERVDEYKRVQGLREDADTYMTKFCLSSQDIYYENQALFDSEIDSHTLCEELMLNDSLHLYISRKIVKSLCVIESRLPTVYLGIFFLNSI